jgi:hypothetical protein
MNMKSQVRVQLLAILLMAVLFVSAQPSAAQGPLEFSNTLIRYRIVNGELVTNFETEVEAPACHSNCGIEFELNLLDGSGTFVYTEDQRFQGFTTEIGDGPFGIVQYENLTGSSPRIRLAYEIPYRSLPDTNFEWYPVLTYRIDGNAFVKEFPAYRSMQSLFYEVTLELTSVKANQVQETDVFYGYADEIFMNWGVMTGTFTDETVVNQFELGQPFRADLEAGEEKYSFNENSAGNYDFGSPIRMFVPYYPGEAIGIVFAIYELDDFTLPELQGWYDTVSRSSIYSLGMNDSQFDTVSNIAGTGITYLPVVGDVIGAFLDAGSLGATWLESLNQEAQLGEGIITLSFDELNTIIFDGDENYCENRSLNIKEEGDSGDYTIGVRLCADIQ